MTALFHNFILRHVSSSNRVALTLKFTDIQSDQNAYSHVTAAGLS